MNKNIKKIRLILINITIIRTLYRLFLFIIRYPTFIIDFVKFRNLQKKNKQNTAKIKDLFPCLYDKTKKIDFDPHYTYHPAWAARIISKILPENHVDVSSTLQFSTMVSAFVPVRFYDYRPANIKLSNLESKHADLNKLPFLDNSMECVSCMHVIEHIGLGRYGDKLDSEGDMKAINELRRVIKPGGNLIFVVPVGKPRVSFNAHRIYSYDQLMSFFPNFEIKDFSLIPDNYLETGLISNPNKKMVDKQDWGCGCLWLVKK